MSPCIYYTKVLTRATLPSTYGQLWTLLYLEDIVCMVYTYFKVNDFRYYTQDLILTKDKAQSDVFLCQHFNVSQMAIYIQTH